MQQINLDEGYQFGLGAFETIAVYDGTPVLLKEHLERLAGAAKFLGIKCEIQEKEIRKQAEELGFGAYALKVMISEKNLLFSTRENPYERPEAKKSFAAEYSPVFRNETSPLVRYKTLNYGDCILEKRRGAALGVDELIFVNSKGEICEGCTSNVFFEKAGRLYTPPVSCGLLPGVLRRWITEHYPVEERVIKKGDEAWFDGCFLTNSLMGVMPLVRLAQTEFKNKGEMAYDEISSAVRQISYASGCMSSGSSPSYGYRLLD